MIPRSLAIAASSICIGFGLGYIVAERRLVKHFENRIEKETSSMKVFYTSNDTKKYASPQEAVKDLIVKDLAEGVAAEKMAYHKIVKEYNSENDENPKVGTNGVTLVPATLHQNVFESQSTVHEAYVISQEEYMQNDPEHEQATLTYYADDTLADERDDVIDDVKRVVGEDCFGQFGVGSSDDNVVHVRNNRLRMDFEIIQSDRTYAQDVLGETE